MCMWCVRSSCQVAPTSKWHSANTPARDLLTATYFSFWQLFTLPKVPSFTCDRTAPRRDDPVPVAKSSRPSQPLSSANSSGADRLAAPTPSWTAAALAGSRPATRPAKPFTSAAELHAHRRATHGLRLLESSPEHGRRDPCRRRAAAAAETTFGSPKSADNHFCNEYKTRTLFKQSLILR